MTRPIQSDGRVHGVTVACQGENDRWLLIRRSEHVAAPGLICFPGGGVELGECRAATAHREFMEEVGGKIQLDREIWHHVCDDKPLTLFGWLADMQTPADELVADPKEVAELLWLTLDEAVNHPDALSGTAQFCKAIVNALCEKSSA